MGEKVSPKPSVLARSAANVRMLAGSCRLMAVAGAPARFANIITAIKTAVTPTSPMPLAIFHPYPVVALFLVIISGCSLLFDVAVATASMTLLHHAAVDAG